MNNNVFLKVAGVITCVVALGLNLQFACDGYGVKTGSLHHEVLAQTNSDGGSSSGDNPPGGTSGGDSSGGGTSGGTSGGDSSDGDDSSGGSSSGTKPSDKDLWERIDGDCEYTFSGQAGAKIKLFGVTVLTLNGEGEGTYTYKDGKTRCKSGGDEQCEARYCPQL